MSAKRRGFPVAADDAGRRLDRVLRRLLPGVPLPEIYRRLRTGSIRVDGRKVEPGFRPEAGATIELAPDLLRELEPASRSAPKRPGRVGPPPPVVFSDRDLLVIDKPAGLVVQPGAAGTIEADDYLLARCAPLLPARAAGPAAFRPAPAHRIDRGTSGLVVVGVSGAGLRGMVEAFKERRVRKTYLAVVEEGRLRKRQQGLIDLPIRTEAAHGGGRRSKTGEDGRPARTVWRLVGPVGDGLAVLEVDLGSSGRTHQIRVHLAAIDAPLVGDRKYGGVTHPAHRPLLHAWRLAFEHPVSGEALQLEAGAPREFRRQEPRR